MDFAKAIEEFKKKTLVEVDKRIIDSARAVFNSIIDYSPIADERYQATRGTFVNSWNIGIGNIIVREASNPTADKGSAYQAVQNMPYGVFLKGDTFVSMANGASHANRVEYLGWPQQEGWSGTSGYNGTGAPYSPVRRGKQAFKIV
jgi:hypothetical protein